MKYIAFVMMLICVAPTLTTESKYSMYIRSVVSISAMTCIMIYILLIFTVPI